MDIYFCDECGARVTDLDLRGGKGMRQRNDSICAACVERGQAGEWLARSGRPASAIAAVAAGSHEGEDDVGVAVAIAPDPISVARDRARTVPDEAARLRTPLPTDVSHDTDAITNPAPPPPRKPRKTPADDFAAAGDGMGALISAPSSRPSAADEADDQPDDDKPKSDESADDLTDDAPLDEDPAPGHIPPAPADSPFDFAGGDAPAANPGKVETAEVAVAPPPEAEAEPRPSKANASGRQASQRKSSSTSRRNGVKPGSGRRPVNPMGSTKVLVGSLISFVVMLLIAGGIYMSRTPAQHGPQKIETNVLDVFAKHVKDADQVTNHAVGSPNDRAAQVAGKQALNDLNRYYEDFDREARKLGWGDDGFEQQLKNLGYFEVLSRRKAISDRLFILEQQEQPEKP